MFVLLQRIGSILLRRRAAARCIARLLRQLPRLTVDRITAIILVSPSRALLCAFFPCAAASSSRYMCPCARRIGCCCCIRCLGHSSSSIRSTRDARHRRTRTRVNFRHELRVLRVALVILEEQLPGFIVERRLRERLDEEATYHLQDMLDAEA